MPLVFPTAASDPQTIRRGAGRFYLCTYVAAGADAEIPALDAAEFFTLLHVRLAVGGEIVPDSNVHDVLFPAGQSFVHHLNLAQQVDVGGERGGDGAIGELISDANLQLVQTRQHVELGQVDVREPVDSVLHSHRRAFVHTCRSFIRSTSEAPLN